MAHTVCACEPAAAGELLRGSSVTAANPQAQAVWRDNFRNPSIPALQLMQRHVHIGLPQLIFHSFSQCIMSSHCTMAFDKVYIPYLYGLMYYIHDISLNMKSSTPTSTHDPRQARCVTNECCRYPWYRRLHEGDWRRVSSIGQQQRRRRIPCQPLCQWRAFWWQAPGIAS